MKFQNKNNEKMSLKIDFNVANSADTDEMLPNAKY